MFLPCLGFMLLGWLSAVYGVSSMNIVRFVGDRWNEGEVERLKTRFKPPSSSCH